MVTMETDDAKTATNVMLKGERRVKFRDMSTDIDFVSGSAERHSPDKSKEDLSLCYAYPVMEENPKTSSVLRRNKTSCRVLYDKNAPAEDGLYVSDNPLTDKLIKPYRLDDVKPMDYETGQRFRGKLVEIAVRDVRIGKPQNQPEASIEIISVSILFGKKAICRANHPFNRKLYKLLIRNSDCHNLSVQVHAQHGESSVLPLPLPKRCVKDNKLEIDFAIGNHSGQIYSGTVTCTISLSSYGTSNEREESVSFTDLHGPSNDPNDPQNSLSLLKPRKTMRKKQVKYFSLQDPALTFDAEIDLVGKTRPQKCKPPDIVVTEQPAFSLLDLSFGNLFQPGRPLRPSSSTRKHRSIGRTILTVTVLRGVEVPVREESALVSPLLEVEWGDVVHTTSVADGPAPIWQQTMHFELPKQNGEHCVNFRLYDQHPVWGQQWLGEARIPLERHRNYQELERWIALSPLFSPVLLFGYVQASPGQSHTRIYVLMKMEQPGNAKSPESNAINALSNRIQRCVTIPCKIVGVETPEDAIRFAMLLSPLPDHYGPVTPRQALQVNKIDHYGRAALLATLLQGFDMRSYILLGASQISKWTAFVLSIDGDDATLWDPEIGDRYKLSDSRCSLMKVSRLIDHSGIWENLQKSILPDNLNYNVTISKEWRPLAPIVTSTAGPSVQTLESSTSVDEESQKQESTAQMEQYLRDKLSGWRSAVGLTTIFNRHAVTVLRNFICKIPNETKPRFDKRDLKQLHRAYHTHGFLLNLRETALNELAEQIAATKVHNITGPIEFALVCHLQRYIGKTHSLWIGLAILRSRN